MNKTNDDDKYKEDNSQHQHSNESFMNKTKEEEELIKRLMSMNFKKNVIQYVIDIITLCGWGMIELEKVTKRYQAKINGKHFLLFHKFH